MGTHRPDYLQHVEVRRQGADRTEHTCAVVLLPAARPSLPQHFQEQLTGVPAGQEIHLGQVTPRHLERSTRGMRTPPAAWTFSCRGHPRHLISATYTSRHDAAESCAIETIDGPIARQRFDLDRWKLHRPTDN
jgi:hypothetical protein